MWPYWLLFLLPALAAFTQPSQPWAMKPPHRLSQIELQWCLTAIALALFIGWRHEVGGDWWPYLGHMRESSTMTLGEALVRGDPGHWLLNWAVARAGGSIYTVNLLCAIVFSVGLVVFCRYQPRPWLALAVAIPYMVIVVGMGYTRQAVALGMALLGLVALGRGRTMTFVAWVALGALFHKSAVLLIPVGMLASPGRSRWWTVLWVGFAGVLLYEALLSDDVDQLVTNYVDAEVQSQGAALRVMMNVLPAVALLLFRKRMTWGVAERRLWTMMALMALASVGWLAVSSSSTAVDRVALYLIPLQLYVFSRLPDILPLRVEPKRAWVTIILVYYATVQFVWLGFADNSSHWLPFRFYPLEGAW